MIFSLGLDLISPGGAEWPSALCTLRMLPITLLRRQAYEVSRMIAEALMNYPPNVVVDEVARAARGRLRGSSSVVLRAVSCEYEQDVLVLRGRVPTEYCKQLAQQIVTGAAGLAQVVNEIEVTALSSSGVAHHPVSRVSP
jgi:osmotically-inducible protein OsmY